MTATGDTFATTSGSGGSIQVEPGGHLKAANTTFNLNYLSLNNASIYASGDLAGDTFNMPIYVPYGDVQYLAGNAKFEQIYINAATPALRPDAGAQPDRHQYVEPAVRLLGRLHGRLGGNAERRVQRSRPAHGRPDDHRQRDA